MSKKNRYTILITLSLWFPTMAMAIPDHPISNFFDIPSSDFSLLFLGMLFGQAGSVLSGSGTMMPLLFRAFNNIALTLGAIVLLYLTVVGIVNTAWDGEALGKKWASPWVVARTAFGFAMLAPLKTGYSGIQIFVLWVVLQGVGAANLVWNTAIDYFDTGGQVVAVNSLYAGQEKQPYLQAASNVMGSLACVYRIQNTIDNDNRAANKTIHLDDYKFIQKGNAGSYVFPGELSGVNVQERLNFQGRCGEIKMNASRNDIVSDQSYQRAAALQVIQAVESAARSIARQEPGTPLSKTLNIEIQNAMLQAATAYMNIVSPLARQLSNTTEALGRGVADDMRRQGWIMAGSYYYNLMKVTDSALSTNKALQPESNLISNKGSLTSPVLIDLKDISTDIHNAVDNNFKIAENTATNHDDFRGVNLKAVPTVGGKAKQILGILTAGLSDVVKSWERYFGYHSNDPQKFKYSDPLPRIALFGQACMEAVSKSWIIGAATLFGIGLLGGIVGCSAAALNLMVMWLLPIVALVMTALLATGMVTAYYIPMVPFILFTFGGIGWLIGVIESLCAAPIVAVFFTYPDGGHDVFGKAEPAIYLLINLFLRPSLMIIGMLSGMALCFVGVNFLNAGFSYAFSSMMSAIGLKSGIITGIFPPLGVMILYTGLITVVVTKSFQLVNIVPDKVLRWIEGGQAAASAFGEEARGMEDQTRQSYESGAGKIGDAAGKSFQEGGKATFQAGQETGAKAKEAATQAATGGTTGGAEAAGGGGDAGGGAAKGGGGASPT